MVWGGLEVVWWWFGTNMAGQRNKYAFKFLLQLLILSQKHILGVKKVVWGGLDVVWGGLEVVWGGLGCFGVVWGVSTDPYFGLYLFTSIGFLIVSMFRSLPKGGVALEFDNKEQADKILNNWPSDAFGKDSQCHSPLGRKKTVGFLKNIPIHVKSSQLQDIYSNTCTVKSIRRLVFRSTHKPMPVVRIEFHTEEDFEKAKSTVIHYCTNGKPAFLEAERPFKLIRCFNCHRIGHIGRACLYESRCGNCSATDHTDNDCNKQSKCPNCEGNHHASSNLCPTYQHILQLHRNQLLL